MKQRYNFQIVEGTVVAVARRRNWTYLNFGPDYRLDFTIAVRAGDRQAFKGSDMVLGALAGRRLRVRGWIESWNGPLIKVSHPEQIEVLDEQARDPQEAWQAKDPAPKAPGPSN